MTALSGSRVRLPDRVTIVVSPVVVEAVRRLIAGRAGHPCPDNRLLAEVLGVNVQMLRAALDLLEARGELRIQRSAFTGGLRRRMRVKVHGRWRNWTQLTKRHAYDLRIVAPDLLRTINTHHLSRVLIAGRYD
jgi:hypothetical protein